MKTDKVKVAIVCDWLTGIGGAERVVLELHNLYPDAPIYTSQYNPNELDWFKDADVRTGWLQKLPVRLKKFLPVLRAWYFSHLDLSGYDVVISSSGAEAKAIKTPENTHHICYMHSPTHYYWVRYEEYLRNPGFGKFDWLARYGLRFLVGPMRTWDYHAAQRPDTIIANSQHTKKMIKRFYNRSSTVIHPPVDTKRFHANILNRERSGLVVAGRQTPYKRIDLAVEACTSLNIPLTVIGDGPDHAKLIAMAGPSVHFRTGLSDTEIPKFFQNAKALIFPNMDDFGITAVEAMSSGTPVVAYKSGGALDYIIDGTTGVFFKNQTVASLSGALLKVMKTPFDVHKIEQHAEQFSVSTFHKKIRSFVRKQIAR